MGKADVYYPTPIHHLLNTSQDPPEQVIRDCNKEVDEALRRVKSPSRLSHHLIKAKECFAKVDLLFI